MKFFILGMLLVSTASAQHAHHGQTHKMSVARKSLSSTDKDWMATVLKKNDELFNAFLKKDNALIEKKAQELHFVIQKNSSFKNISTEGAKLVAIKATRSREDNLDSYEAFLKPLINAVQSYDVGKNYNIFSCPMVKKSWIQDTDTNKNVRNVYAMEMLECGTQDTKF